MHHSAHHNLILNHISPLRRKSLLGWIAEAPARRKFYHHAYLLAWLSASLFKNQAGLPLKERIACILALEFGPRLKSSRSYTTLIERVRRHLIHSP